MEEHFAKATMCGSFRRAAPFVEHLQNYTEEKDQIIFWHAVLLSHMALSLNKIIVFSLLKTDYDAIKKLKIKENITPQILCLSI